MTVKLSELFSFIEFGSGACSSNKDLLVTQVLKQNSNKIRYIVENINKKIVEKIKLLSKKNCEEMQSKEIYVSVKTK